MSRAVTVSGISAVLLITTLMGVGMTDSLVLPNAQSLSGRWIVSDGKRLCLVVLQSNELADIDAYEMVIGTRCDKSIFSAPPAAWRPAPDGIALVGNAGETLMFFSKEGEEYRNRINGDIRMVLRHSQPDD